MWILVHALHINFSEVHSCSFVFIDSLSTGIIAGVVVAMVVVIALIISAVIMWNYRCKQLLLYLHKQTFQMVKVMTMRLLFASPTVDLKMQQSAAYGQVSNSEENSKSEIRMKESSAYISVTNQETTGISLYDSVLYTIGRH